MIDTTYLAESRTLLALADALDTSGASRISTGTLRAIARRVMGGEGLGQASADVPIEGHCGACGGYHRDAPRWREYPIATSRFDPRVVGEAEEGADESA